jgi:hypothetical protein
MTGSKSHSAMQHPSTFGDEAYLTQFYLPESERGMGNKPAARDEDGARLKFVKIVRKRDKHDVKIEDVPSNVMYRHRNRHGEEITSGYHFRDDQAIDVVHRVHGEK